MIDRRSACIAIVTAATALYACGIKNEANVCGTETKNVGTDCSSTYKMCAGQVYELDCAKGANGFSCTCVEDGKRGKTFESADVCSVTPQTVRARAQENCEWKLD